MEVSDVIARIQSHFDDLSPQLRQAARHVLAHPEEVALTSMRRLAAHAGVKPSTMVRFARAVGFDGFEDLREPFRDWLRGGEGAYEARARRLTDRDDAEITDFVHEMQDAARQALDDGADDANVAALVAAGDALIRARRVYVLGLRSSFALAHYFRYALGMVHDDVRLIDGGVGMLDSLRGIGPQDVLLAIGFRPYTRETVRAVEVAAPSGAAIIALTDSPVSPLAMPDGPGGGEVRAAHVIVAQTATPNFFQSLVGPLALIEQLLGVAVSRSGDAGLAAIKESEMRLKQFDAYWQEPRRRRSDHDGSATGDGDGDVETDE